MREFFQTYPLAAWSVVSTMLALVVVATLWEKLKWWWHNTWYKFPFIGRLNGLSHDVNEDPAHKGWFKAERTLCRDYKQFIRIQDEHDFNEKITYLTKAGDNGRHDTPGWIWLLTAIMVFVEAMGFSYVLAGYTLPGASENLQQTGAYGIAFLISVILVAFTHFAGHELYKSNLIKKARGEWVAKGRVGDFSTGTIPLARPQSQDDEHPIHTQLANRVDTHPSYFITGLTAVIVVVIALLATYVRGQVLEKQLEQQVTLQTSEAGVSISVGSSSLNMSIKAPNSLPDADLASNRQADTKAIREEANIDRHGGWGTFIALAFIFVFLQILGVIFGYRWGFAGKDSAKAYNAIGKGRYATYADVRADYQHIADTAQSMLENLQQRLMDRNSRVGNSGLHTSKTFREFMQEMRVEEADERAHERETASRIAAIQQRPLTPPVAAAAPLEATTTAAAPAAPAPAPATPADEVARAVAHLRSLAADPDARQAYIASLPPDLYEKVVATLKAEKEDKARLAQKRASELEDLL